MVTGVAAYDQILPSGGFNDIYNIRHADDSFVLLKQWRIVDLKKLAFSNGLIDWIPFQHERQFGSNIKSNDVITLSSSTSLPQSPYRLPKTFFRSLA